MFLTDIMHKCMGIDMVYSSENNTSGSAVFIQPITGFVENCKEIIVNSLHVYGAKHCI